MATPRQPAERGRARSDLRILPPDLQPDGPRTAVDGRSRAGRLGVRPRGLAGDLTRLLPAEIGGLSVPPTVWTLPTDPGRSRCPDMFHDDEERARAASTGTAAHA